MPNFICKVLTPQGQIVKIKMTEEDKITVLKKLKKNSMTPISVEINKEIKNAKSVKSSAVIYSKRNKKTKAKLKDMHLKISDSIKIEDIIKFTQDFYLLKKSKFTNKHALITIVNNAENEKFKDILHKMIKNLDSGIHMYKTMKEYPEVFPFIYVNIIKIGELNGLLEEALKNAITYLKDEENLKYNIEKHVFPHIIMLVGIIVMVFLSVLIGIPLIQDVFASNGNIIALPTGIRLLSYGLKFIIKYWYIIVLAFLLILVGFIGYINTKKGKTKYDYFKYKNFLFGKIVYLFDFSRFIRCLSINIKNKVRFQDALEVSKNVISNTYMLTTIEESINNIYMGKSWITPFEKDKILDPITLEILKKGVNSNVEDALEKIIEYSDIEIEKELKRVLKLLPRMSYIIVGIILLLFLALILIPCIQIYLGEFLFL